MEREHGKPFLGRMGAGVVTTVVGGLLLFALSIFINAPSQVDADSQGRHNRQQALIERNRAKHLEEVTELRAEIGQLRTDIASIRIQLEDRIREEETWRRLLDERHADTRRTTEDLDNDIKFLRDYMTEERRRKSGK